MAGKINGLSREFIIHPGETLKEVLEERVMSQRELAIRTSVKEPHISGIVNGQKPISVSFAKKLEYALGIDASFWINLQANYEKELADFEDFNQISTEEQEIVKKIKGISDYTKDLGLIDREAQGAMLVIEWRKLLNLSSLSMIPEMSRAGAYRLALAENVDPFILFTWLRVCDLITKEQQVMNSIDVKKLESKLYLIRNLAFEDIETINKKLKEHLAECGIRFAVVKHFTGAPVQGVIQKNQDETLSLIMTLRRKFADVFWFTLFHEFGHIINGDIKERLIDYEGTENEIEEGANEFAANTLINLEQYNLFTEAGDFSRRSIMHFCEVQNIPIYILIGRLQRDGIIGY